MDQSDLSLAGLLVSRVPRADLAPPHSLVKSHSLRVLAPANAVLPSGEKATDLAPQRPGFRGVSPEWG
jgi:hypothetical protein